MILLLTQLALACPTHDPNLIATLCELRCHWRLNTPVCRWVAKPRPGDRA